MKKQYLYHVTEEDWGENVTLSPRAYGSNRCSKEPDVSRICCAPTIEGCLVAIVINQMNTLNVYRTLEKVESQKPFEVLDAHITGERWVTELTDFAYICNLDSVKDRFSRYWIELMNEGYLIGGVDIESRRWQRKMKAKIKEFLTSSTKYNRMYA